MPIFLFELISRRYEHKSTVITTNRAFKEWHEVFPNAACVVSLIDRLVHHSGLEEFRDVGIPRAEALALCAKFLGHGAMRTQFISAVYGKTVVSTYPKQRRTRSFKAAVKEIDELIAAIDFKK